MYGYRKRVGVFLVLLILILAITFCFLRGASPVQGDSLGAKAVAPSSKKITSEYAEESVLIPSTNDVEAISQRHLSAADINSIKTWELAHGYFDSSDLQEYKSYSLESLKTLANGGDLKALQLISEYYIENGDLDAAFKNFKHAAIYGSTQALYAYSIFSGIYFRNAKTPEIKEIYAIDALAFLAVAARRGDSYAELRGSADFEKEYNFNPSSDQIKAIAKRASEIYSDFESARALLGLPVFDNTANTAAQRVYSVN